MTEGNLAPKYRRIPRRSHNHNQQNNLNLRLIQLNRRRHLKGAQTRLSLSRLEKDVLAVGLVLIMALALILVSTKVTDDVYQHQIMSVNAKIFKFRSFNNTSRQKISDLESSGRLHKIAHKNHLKFSSDSVRNVK